MAAAIFRVLEQHLEECTHLWNIRDHTVRSAARTLEDLVGLDDRIEAHLEGLALAEEDGWAISIEHPPLAAGDLFPAAFLALQDGREEKIARILALAKSRPGLERAVISALGWLPSEKIELLARRWLDGSSSEYQAIGIRALCLHRKNPGRILPAALASGVSEIVSCALRAIGELGRSDLARDCGIFTRSDDPATRFYANWSLAFLAGESAAIHSLMSMAESDTSFANKALTMAVRRAPLRVALAWYEDLAQNAMRRRMAIHCAAEIGVPDLIDWLIAQMRITELARPAGSAWTAITGISLVDAGLVSDAPEGFESGPNADPLDSNVTLNPDDELPWPDPSAVEAWWKMHRAQFNAGKRLLLGRPLEMDWLLSVLRKGPQTQRAAAALELSFASKGHLFDVKAPGLQQKRLLANPAIR